MNIFRETKGGPQSFILPQLSCFHFYLETNILPTACIRKWTCSERNMITTCAFIISLMHLLYFVFLCIQALPFPSQVVYNRVGKCGSRTVVILLRLLAEKHQFNLISSDIHNKTRLTKHEQVSSSWCRDSLKRKFFSADGSSYKLLQIQTWT